MKTTLLKTAMLVLLAGAFAVGCATETKTASTTTAVGVKPYPLDYCIVSGNKIGAMGKPIVLVYQGQEIKFCCKDCVKDFKKDPEKYIKKVAEEQAKAAAAEKK